MGFHIEQVNSPTVTPRFCFNASGSPAWSGRYASTLTASELIDILQFCQAEGSRIGFNDAHNACISDWNPFHPLLLGGFPQVEWSAAYRAGVSSYQAGCAGFEVQDDLVDEKTE